VAADIPEAVRAAGLGAAEDGETAACAQTERPGTKEEGASERKGTAAASEAVEVEGSERAEETPEPADPEAEEAEEAEATESEVTDTASGDAPGRGAVAVREGRVASVEAVEGADVSGAGEGRTLVEIGRASTTPGLVEGPLLPADGSATEAVATGLLPPSASLVSRAARVTASIGGD
jgi:hypothetical protein